MDCKEHQKCKCTQYCQECKELVCIMCQSKNKQGKCKGHSIISVNDIAQKIIESLTSKKEEAGAYDEVKQEIAGDKNTIDDIIIKLKNIKETYLNYIHNVIEEIFAKPFKFLSEKKDEISKFSEKYQIYISNIEAEIEKFISLLNEEKNYKKLCEEYEKYKKNDIIKPIDNVNFKEIKIKLKQFHLPEPSNEFKTSLKNLIYSIPVGELVCPKCHKGKWDKKDCVQCKKVVEVCSLCGQENCIKCNKFYCSNCLPSDLLCDSCKSVETAIFWNNNSKLFKGDKNKWVTFCSNKILPKYFKCKVRVHEYFKPESGCRLVGLSLNSCDETGNYFTKSNNCWALNNDLGIWNKFTNSKGRGKVTYGNAGDIVTIVYNKSKTIRFEVNGVDTGQQFENIEGPFYLACADCSNSTYEIIEVIHI